jgi:L-2-hydroxyglutarate oxidase
VAGETCDIVVVGAGIVGLATARALVRRRPTARLVVVDKAPRVAAHQSSHNSGVLHSGVYYAPGSLKARLCVEGRAALERLCTAWGVPWRRCGKVIVATSVDELARLDELRRRADANGIEARLVDRRGLAELEPWADGVAALHVPATGIVDFAAVCRALADDLTDRGVELALGEEVTGVERRADGVVVRTSAGRRRARGLVNCAGLHSDRLARLAGARPPVRIVPFRGEYHELAPEGDHLVRALVYPVPDPRFPFLGVHLTRGLDGRVHAGPNAVPALAREGYRRRDVDRATVLALATDGATRRLARRYWRTGAEELWRSWSRRRLARALQRLVPDLRAEDLRPSGAGVRAQAVRPDGSLVDDFAFAETPRAIHVLNAPSPAATAALAIGGMIAARALERNW